MLREIIAFGASGRFSSHSFDKWCLPVLERRGSFSLGFMAFNSRPSAFSYLSTECKQKASRDVIDGKGMCHPCEQNLLSLVTFRFSFGSLR